MWRRKNVDVEARERLDGLEKSVRALRDDLVELMDKFVRLRGKVYAHKLHLPEDERTSPRPAKETKADLLRKAGFVPGRPMVHKESPPTGGDEEE